MFLRIAICFIFLSGIKTAGEGVENKMNFIKEEFLLSNGVSVLYSPDDSNDLVSVHCFLDLGSIDEKPKKQGIRNLCAMMLDKGASGRSRDEIAKAFESAGALYGSSSGDDYTSFSVTCPEEKLEPVLDLFSKVLSKPDFPETEFDKEKFLVIQGIKAKEEDIFSVAEDAFLEEMFGKNNPYGRENAGTVKTVSGLKLRDLKDFYGKYFVRERMFFVVVGKTPKEEIKALLERGFFPYRSKPYEKAGYKSEKLKKNAVIKQKKNFLQSFLITGVKAPPIGSRDYFALKLASAALGGNMSSRFFRILREENALAYAAGSGYPTRRYESFFFTYIGLDQSNLEFAQKKIAEENKKLIEEGLTAGEIADYKTYIKSGLLFSYQSKSRRAWYFGFWKVMGCPIDFDLTYTDMIDGLTRDEVNSALKKILSQNTVESVVIPK